MVLSGLCRALPPADGEAAAPSGGLNNIRAILGSAGGSSGEVRRQAAWELVRVVPHMEAVLQQLAGSGQECRQVILAVT